ncbi:MAG: helix-turn-helix domain-containing protein [Acidimicrobiales bacterium]
MTHPLLHALEPLAEALGATLVEPSAVEPGDVPLQWDGDIVGGFRQAGLRGALERLLGRAESEAGRPLDQLDRESKQDVVRLLDAQGAFVIRRAVEEVADRLGVSRFTVYNYLNAVNGDRRERDGGEEGESS